MHISWDILYVSNFVNQHMFKCNFRGTARKTIKHHVTDIQSDKPPRHDLLRTQRPERGPTELFSHLKFARFNRRQAHGAPSLIQNASYIGSSRELEIHSTAFCTIVPSNIDALLSFQRCIHTLAWSRVLPSLRFTWASDVDNGMCVRWASKFRTLQVLPDVYRPYKYINNKCKIQ